MPPKKKQKISKISTQERKLLDCIIKPESRTPRESPKKLSRQSNNEWFRPSKRKYKGPPKIFENPKLYLYSNINQEPPEKLPTDNTFNYKNILKFSIIDNNVSVLCNACNAPVLTKYCGRIIYDSGFLYYHEACCPTITPPTSKRKNMKSLFE